MAPFLSKKQKTNRDMKVEDKKKILYLICFSKFCMNFRGLLNHPLQKKKKKKKKKNEKESDMQ